MLDPPSLKLPPSHIRATADKVVDKTADAARIQNAAGPDEVADDHGGIANDASHMASASHPREIVNDTSHGTGGKGKN